MMLHIHNVYLLWHFQTIQAQAYRKQQKQTTVLCVCVRARARVVGACVRVLVETPKCPRQSRPTHKNFPKCVLFHLMSRLAELLSIEMWLSYFETIKINFYHDRRFDFELMFPVRVFRLLQH
jgi:hypothetical protein